MLSPSGQTKVLAVWDQLAQSGGAPYIKGNVELEGRVFDSALINAGLYELSDEPGHGTETVSAAIGNMTGTATAADVVFVRTSTSLDPMQMQRGMGFIADYANRLDMPYIICICQGFFSGSRDGYSDTIEKAMAELLRRDYSDTLLKAIVVSAGNQNWDPAAGNEYNRIHVREDGSHTFDLDIATTDSTCLDDMCKLEIWYHIDAPYRVSLFSPSGYAITDIESAPLDEKNVVEKYTFDGYMSVSNEIQNYWGRVHIVISDIYTNEECEFALADGTWKIKMKSLRRKTDDADRRWDAYITLSAPNQRSTLKVIDADDHSNEYKIINGGNVPATITVGSITELMLDTLFNGAAHLDEYNGAEWRVSSFSSRGPNRLDIEKPDIYAVGDFVPAALSSDRSQRFLDSIKNASDCIDPDLNVFLASGTSLAAPRVAGQIAVLLSESKRHDLRHWEIKEIILETARNLADADESFRVINLQTALEMCRTYPTLQAQQAR